MVVVVVDVLMSAASVLCEGSGDGGCAAVVLLFT